MIRLKVHEYMGRDRLRNVDVARKTGIRETTVSHLYHSKVKRLDLDHLDKLCKLFNCTPGDLIEYVDEENV